MLNKLVSNEDVVRVEANQSRQGEGAGKCAAQWRQKSLTELIDTQDAVTASSSGFWDEGRVNIIKLYTDLGLENTGTCCGHKWIEMKPEKTHYSYSSNPRMRLEIYPNQCPP